MANKSDLKPENEIDKREAERFDVANREQRAGKEYSNSGIDRAEAYASDPKNASGKDLGAIARNAEQSSNPMNYSGGQSTQQSGFKKFTARITGRKAATGGIIGLLFGGIFGFSVLLSPSIGIMHMAETLFDDLNDAVPALDSMHYKQLRAQTKDMGRPLSSCTLVQFRCGLKGMSDRQIRQYSKAGIEVETVGEKNSLTRRTAVKSMTFTKSDGSKIEITNPRELRRQLTDKGVRNQIRRAYNPHFYSVSDKVASLTLRKLGLTRKNLFTSDSPEENKRAYADATSDKGGTADFDRRPVSDNPDEDQAARQDNTERQRFLDRLKGQTDGVLLKGGLRGVGALGAADSACTAYGLARGVQAASKAIRSVQLMKYASTFLAFAGAMKAGDATPAAAEMWGNVLTATDTNKKIVNETSENDTDEVDNPYYGKNAFDSEGYRAAAYNDAPVLTARAQSMMTGGAAVGTLGAALATISSRVDTSKCEYIQNWFVRGASLIIGIGAGIFSGGTTLLVSIGASLAISAFAVILASYLKDIIAGTTVTEDTEGIDSGNALFSGSSEILGNMALARGMKPATVDELREYDALARTVEADILAMEREDAQKTPFDISNQHTFLGSLARSAVPVASSMSMQSFSLGRFLGSIPSLITPSVSAIGVFNEDRFQLCNDDDYERMGIDADVFCNIRYVFPKAEMEADIEVVYKYMWDNRYVDEAGTPVEGLYQDWIKECPERETALGIDPSEDNKDLIGRVCVDGKRTDGEVIFTRAQLKNFRVFHLSRTVEDGLENGPDFNPIGGADGEGSVVVATFNLRGASHTGGVFRDRMDRSIDTIEAGGYDIVGFQEFEKSQRDYFKSQKGDEYAIYPEGNSNEGLRLSNAIAYRKDRFEVVSGSSGVIPGLRYFSGGRDGSTRSLDAPYVMLREKTSGGYLYFLNTHDPTGQNYAKVRVDNAKQYVNFIENTLLRRNPDTPIVLTGDFNAKYTVNTSGGNITYQQKAENISYCIITKSPDIVDAYDSSSGRPEKCPNKPDRYNPIDQIYMSSNVSASDYQYVGTYGSGGYTINGSDHPTIAATLSVPGMGVNTGGSGDWSWPLEERWWNTAKADMLDPHVADSGTWTSGVRRLAVDIGDPGFGAPVYAMFGGKVTRGDLGGHGLLITSEIQGGELQIAYAHGPRTNNNTTYEAGDQIMSIACLGNCRGAHLHIDMAFNGKGVCPQDVFLAFDKGQVPDFNQLTTRAVAPCGRL